jgi:hypothetical protein
LSILNFGELFVNPVRMTFDFLAGVTVDLGSCSRKSVAEILHLIADLNAFKFRQSFQTGHTTKYLTLLDVDF